MPCRADCRRGACVKTRVTLVQQGVWTNSHASMPLAMGYLKACADADTRIHARMDVTIQNYAGDVGSNHMARGLFRDGFPDILCFSVLGWNHRTFGALAETFKQLNPAGWVIFGGNHVAHQAERVFRLFPQVDVVVNGEGEPVFPELLHAYLDGGSPRELHGVRGISFREDGGALVTTAERPRIEDLDSLPSPILSGAIPLTDARGEFPYGYALLETNRGCPYKCSFCYWGGATGQKMRSFSRARLRAELELLGRHRAPTLVLCDSNFGMLPADEDFLDDLLAVRARYGYPRSLETSWAKNKSAGFFRIMAKLREAGMHNSFILALQTMDEATLSRMRRRNMRLNEWEDLVGWLTEREMNVYLELIWGAPGETVETFLAGYDRAARHTPFVAVHQLMVLPNTGYHDKREQYGLVTVRGEQDDFEYVLAHDTMTMADNERMGRFLCWNRVLARGRLLHGVWTALRELAGIPQSQVVLGFADWVETAEDQEVVRLREAAAGTRGDVVDAAVWPLLTQEVLRAWWRDAVRPLLPAHALSTVEEVFRFDLLCQPIRCGPEGEPAEDLPVVRRHGQDWFLRAGQAFDWDVPALLAALRRGERSEPAPCTTDFYYPTGFGADPQHFYRLDAYRGLTEGQLAQRFPAVTG
ncbi:KedN5 family methylcobalamin-dependent radical SAM C-methyltransferase [Crossiella sp. SN42]|uniref:KedN5 family methylcobalamin-dependent radical SAM C-methyltransferase n=1 Tax=Crossiella sp. SN42 TaxID=2944808 RepID=UPI002111C49B|nr:KedN5 family methylcobalamin-dependent radical SAM C-methyltransferase [Crossiella sp. SN42]